MASSRVPLSSLLITLTTFLFLTTSHTLAQLAPAPAAAPANLTAILMKDGRFTTFLRLLHETRVDDQLKNQLANSFTGFTIFAPTDTAFTNLKPGTLNSLTNQGQVELVLFHVLPQFYTFTMFQTASNPLQTQGSSAAVADKLNVTSIGNNQVNVSTGVVETQVNTALYSVSPLAVYPVDKVLLPNSLFGVKAAPAATPSSAPAMPAGKSSPVGSDGNKASSATGLKGTGVGWRFLAGFVGLIGVGSLL